MKRSEARSESDSTTRHAMKVVAIDAYLPIVEENGMVRLMPYLDHVTDTLSRSLIQHGPMLSLTVNPLSSALPADEVIFIGLMLTELVTNALKHARGRARQGTIAMSFEMAGPHWRLLVSDDGRKDVDPAGYATQTRTSVVEAIARKLDASVACSHTILQGTTVIVARGPLQDTCASS
jgi:two-component sensor histidine kinase